MAIASRRSRNTSRIETKERSRPYWAEPRGTIDVDVNVFVPPDRSAPVLEALAALGAETAGVADVVRRDGQARIMWVRTPTDLLFAHDPLHRAADAGAVEVPFADRTIRVLSPSTSRSTRSSTDRRTGSTSTR